MGGLSFDWDDVFAYRIVKEVVIRDRLLGCLHLLGLSILIAYFAMYPMWHRKEYLRLTPVLGHVDYRVIEPIVHNMGSFDHAALPYCKGYNGANGTEAPRQRPCYNAPVVDIIQSSTPDVVYLTSKIIPEFLHVDCLQQTKTAIKDRDCRITERKDEAKTVFVTDLENYSIGFLTAVHTSQSDFSAIWGNEEDGVMMSYELKRYIKLRNGTEKEVLQHPMDTSAEAKIGRVRDWFTVEEVLDLVGVKLDGLDPEGKTFRDNGLSVDLRIEFLHNSMGQLDKLLYKFSYLPLEARYYHLGDHDLDVTGRLNNTFFSSRRGLRMYVSVAGSTGSFSMPDFMIAWVSTFALMGVINIILKFALLYLLPLREVYETYILDKTIDASDFKEGKEHAVKAVNHMIKQSAIHSGMKTFAGFSHSEGRGHWKTSRAAEQVWDASGTHVRPSRMPEQDAAENNPPDSCRDLEKGSFEAHGFQLPPVQDAPVNGQVLPEGEPVSCAEVLPEGEPVSCEEIQLSVPTVQDAGLHGIELSATLSAIAVRSNSRLLRELGQQYRGLETSMYTSRDTKRTATYESVKYEI